MVVGKLIFHFLFTLTAVCSIADQAYAEVNKAIPVIPREVLFGNPEKVSPNLSPDGTMLAYLAPDKNDVLNVWVRKLDGSTPDEQITTDEKRGIRSFLWAFDSQKILYFQDREGDENWHLYLTGLTNKQTRDLTPYKGVRADILAYEPEFPNEMLLAMNLNDPALYDIYRLNLDTGKIALVMKNDHNAFDWLADHQLRVRASRAYDKNGEMVLRVNEDGKGPWKELLRWESDDDGGLIGFSPDGQSLYLLSNENSNTAQFIKMNLTTGKQEVLAEDSQYDLIAGGGQVEIMQNPITRAIEAVGVVREKLEWIVLDPSIKADLANISKKESEFRIISRDLKDQLWIVKYTMDLYPPQYYLYDRTKKESQFLFSSNPKLEQYPTSPMFPISFKARDGLLLNGYLTLPLGVEHKNLPTVLMVHGGPWARDSWGFKSTVQWLANRGYAVIQVNFRGSTGYGKAHLNAGNKEWAAKMHDDLLDAKQWVIDQGMADRSKVAIFGGSYGGYAALVGLTFTPEEFCCGVDIVGPSNLVTLLQTIPPYWSPLKTKMDKRLGNLETEKEFLESRSPLFKADKIQRPLLIAQGANDPRVTQPESDQIVKAIRQNGKEVVYLLFEDEGHGFARPENMLKFCSTTEEFLHKHLGGKLETQKL